MTGSEVAFWNQLQALAWVYTRNHDVAGGLSDEAHEGRTYVIEVKRPRRRKPEMVEIPSAPPTSRSIHLRAAVYEARPVLSLSGAKAALLDHLLRDEITATGIANDAGDRRPIPAIDWLDLDFYDNPMRVAAKSLSRTNSTVWHSVKFSRDDMLLIWPDPEAIEETAPPPALQHHTVRRASRAALEAFFRARAKDIKKDDRAPSEPADIKAVADKFGPNAAARDQIRRLRRKLYPKDSVRVGGKPPIRH